MIKIEFLIIDQDNSGRRLDNFIFSKYKKVPKSKIYSSIRKAKIKVNGKKSKPDYKLCEKDKILIQYDEVIKKMILKLGGKVKKVLRPFKPEGGAYGIGRTHSHKH